MTILVSNVNIFYHCADAIFIKKNFFEDANQEKQGKLKLWAYRWKEIIERKAFELAARNPDYHRYQIITITSYLSHPEILIRKPSRGQKISGSIRNFNPEKFYKLFEQNLSMRNDGRYYLTDAIKMGWARKVKTIWNQTWNYTTKENPPF